MFLHTSTGVGGEKGEKNPEFLNLSEMLSLLLGRRNFTSLKERCWLKSWGNIVVQNNSWKFGGWKNFPGIDTCIQRWTEGKKGINTLRSSSLKEWVTREWSQKMLVKLGGWPCYLSKGGGKSERGGRHHFQLFTKRKPIFTSMRSAARKKAGEGGQLVW